MAHKHKLNTFHLFAGAGGGILADLLLGHNPIGACEIEPYPRDVLLARQRDGHLPAFPIWDDVCTLDGTPWRGTVDVLCGGFPCQDISAAGKGAGISGERSGLWKEYARLIGEIRPRFVFAENSPLLRTRGLGVVLEDLAALGYNARWGVLGARDVGAPHKRDRMWVLAYRCDLAHTSGTGARYIGGEAGDKNGGAIGEYVPTLRQGDRTNGTDRADSTGESKANLAYADNNGQATTEECRSITQGSDSGTPRQEQTSEPSGLCASRANETVAYAKESRLEGYDGNCPPESQQESWPSDTGSEGGNTWWHTDPADLSDSEMFHAQGCSDGSREVELGRSDKREREDDQDRTTKPLVGRVANGVAHRVDRLKAIGNGQVPQCAAMAFSILSEGLI